MSENHLQLHTNTDRELLPREVPAQRVLEIVLQGPGVEAQKERSALNLALVLDRSGSMSGEKMEYVKQAALHVLDLLEAQDRVAVVAYDDEVTLVAPSTPLSNEQRAELKRRVYPLRPGGSTDLSGGWFAGCQEVAAAAQPDSLNRVLLLTDGLANRGITDLEELATHAKELSKRGVSTSTFGVGRGFNEHLLEALSNQGGGTFYYIETPSEIPGLFRREFQELAAVTAREVEVVLTIPPQVNAQVLGGWRVECNRDQMRIFIGSLYAGRTQELYLKLLTPPAAEQTTLSIGVKGYARGEAGQLYEAQGEVTFRYAPQAESEATPPQREVLERYAQVDLAETANEALKLERVGENARASEMLAASVAENRNYAAPAQTEAYEKLSRRMKRGMDEADRKSTHYTTYNQKRRREP